MKCAIALKDQVAVVTGASRGIGQAIALGLAAHDAAVCLVGRRRDTLTMVAERTRSMTARTYCYPADLTSDQEVQELVAGVKRDCGYVDILIHSAGVISLGQIATARIEELDQHYRTNVRAPYLLTQALLPLFRPGQGQVVFINSTAGLDARANVGQYAASKHALKAITDSLREEVNSSGIRVLNVFLGRTATPMQETVHRFENRRYAPDLLLQPEDVAAVIISVLTLPRGAEVTEIRMRPMRKSY